MKTKVTLICIALIIYSVLDHYFIASEYLRIALDSGLLLLGFSLLTKGTLILLKTVDNNGSNINSGLICLLSGGFVISPTGLLGIALALLIIAFLLIPYLKDRSQ